MVVDVKTGGSRVGGPDLCVKDDGGKLKSKDSNHKFYKVCYAMYVGVKIGGSRVGGPDLCV